MIDERLAAIDALVDKEDFPAVEGLVESLPDLIARIPATDRKTALVRIQTFLTSLHSRAETRSVQISSQLKSLKTGRAANSAYAACENLPGID